MNRIWLAVLTITGLMVLYGHTTSDTRSPLYLIPEQRLDLGQMMNFPFLTPSVVIPRFQISRQVTLKEYKEYLRAVERDSSRTFYLSQLPGDGLQPPEIWQQYLTGSEYEDFPALGVSWDQAMNYCRWRTIRDNPGNAMFFYRLPHSSEWLAASHYLSSHFAEQDFNQHYADWLLNAYDESVYTYEVLYPHKWPLDRVYDHKPCDPHALRRKIIIGNTYLYQTERIRRSMQYGYNDRGYRYVGFRYVTEYIHHETE